MFNIFFLYSKPLLCNFKRCNTLSVRSISYWGDTLEETILLTPPEGTLLKNINIYADASDPVALHDNEYPEWLPKLLKTPSINNNVPLDEKFDLDYLKQCIKESKKLSTGARKSNIL